MMSGRKKKLKGEEGWRAGRLCLEGKKSSKVKRGGELEDYVWKENKLKD